MTSGTVASVLHTAPAYEYDELLTVSATGLITSYPRLWWAVF